MIFKIILVDNVQLVDEKIIHQSDMLVIMIIQSNFNFLSDTGNNKTSFSNIQLESVLSVGSFNTVGSMVCLLFVCLVSPLFDLQILSH